MNNIITTVSETRCFSGTVGYYQHQAKSTHCTMSFSVFVPKILEGQKVPVIYYLSGLTCTEDNFTSKAGAYAAAADSGCIIVAPDTSPRGDNVPDEDGWDFGKGAGFYVDATQSPWDKNYQMSSYITEELIHLISDNFPVDISRQGIMGHSMGGHGALTIYLKNQDLFKSVSAFSPIVSPLQCPWGNKALSKYIGEDKSLWRNYDACALMSSLGDATNRPEILIDQGLADPFLQEQLKPELFALACSEVGQKLVLRKHSGYDHGYFFIQTFINDHISHHINILSDS
ncbi:MAG: S-formylglutathione hydrolase [Gammaproteobacteria bacterium]|nr:MAG: S-formylglutathione hydrolase [Gammaproteobacteria bacterium]